MTHAQLSAHSLPPEAKVPLSCSGVKFGIGPAIETGFYYDVDFGGKSLVEADLKAIEDKMIELARQKNAFVRTEVSKEEALKTFTEKGDE